MKPLIDVVNVEGRDSQPVPLYPSGWASQKEQPSPLFRLALFYRWKEMENPELKRIAILGVAGLLNGLVSDAFIDSTRHCWVSKSQLVARDRPIVLSIAFPAA